MLNSSVREGHAALDTIVEGFDEENWSNSAPNSTKSGGEAEIAMPPTEETDLRTRLRRETTESLISNLYSLKPVPFVDTRLIEVGILNEVSIICCG